MADILPFHSPTTHGFVRVAAATPVVHIADPKANGEVHAELIRQAAGEGADLVVFPELSLSAYAIDDLHMQGALLDAVDEAVGAIAEEVGHHPALLTEWGKVTVTWWSHEMRGLHRNDFIMAARTDQLAASAEGRK